MEMCEFKSYSDGPRGRVFKNAYFITMLNHLIISQLDIEGFEPPHTQDACETSCSVAGLPICFSLGSPIYAHLELN